jgi:hypothetical protein
MTMQSSRLTVRRSGPGDRQQFAWPAAADDRTAIPGLRRAAVRAVGGIVRGSQAVMPDYLAAALGYRAVAPLLRGYAAASDRESAAVRAAGGSCRAAATRGPAAITNRKSVR